MNYKVLATGILASLVSAQSAMGANLLLDNFNDGLVDFSAPTTNGSVTTFSKIESGLAGTLGGFRGTELTVEGCNFSPDNCTGVEINVANSGLLDVSIGSRITGNNSTLSITYSDFLIPDLRDYHLELQGYNFDQSAIDDLIFTVDIFSLDGGFYTLPGDLVSDFDANGSGYVRQYFSSLTDMQAKNVVSLRFNATTSQASDYLIDNATLVREAPEPLTILGTVLAGGLGTVLKKRKNY